MSNEKKQNFYTPEFKESAVKLAIEGNQPVSKTAEELGVNANTLHTWISKYSRPVENAKAMRTEDHLYETQAVKKGSCQLAEERDLLKKAAAFLVLLSGQADIGCVA